MCIGKFHIQCTLKPMRIQSVLNPLPLNPLPVVVSSGLSNCVHTEPHPTAIHVMRHAFIGLSVRVYLNFDVFGSVMAASWSNKATKVLLTVWQVQLYIKFNGAHTYLQKLMFPS